MAIIPKKSLFRWKEINVLGDLERLNLLLEALPDGNIVKTLENECFRGRNG